MSEIAEFTYRSAKSALRLYFEPLRWVGGLFRDNPATDFSHLLLQDDEMRGIPIRGLVSAGQLQEAIEANLGTITLETLFPNLDRIFAIRVAGQSMKGADIHDGDYVLLIDDDIPNGGIGAVLYNGETSLKRIYTDENGLRLEPANPEYDDIYIEPDVFEEVHVLGRYVGHVNKNGIYKRTASHPIAA